MTCDLVGYSPGNSDIANSIMVVNLTLGILDSIKSQASSNNTIFSFRI